MKSNELIIEELNNHKINYFSYTLFEDNKPVIYHCNSKSWLNYYNDNYNEEYNVPPVQKYILSTKGKIIVWNLFCLDGLTKQYLDRRNQVVGVTSNLSIISRCNKLNLLSVLTIGSEKSDDYLLNFLRSNPKCLLKISRDLFVN